MKYFYSIYNKDEYTKPYVGRNYDNLVNDSNKIIVIKEDSFFHVITYNNSVVEEEKQILDHPELVEFLDSKKKSVYFFNTGIYLPITIINDVNLKWERDKIEVPIIPETIYTLKDNEILNINVFVNKDTIKDAIREVFFREKEKDSQFNKVSLKEFIENPVLLDMYNLPLVNINDTFKIPEYSYTHPSLFYILNGIYSKRINDKINLDEQNIKDLYLEYYSEDSDILSKIFNSIDIEVKHKYNLDTFSNVIDYLENVKKQENDYSLDLMNVKRIIEKAKQNEEMFNNIDNIKNENKKIGKRKTVTK